MKSIIEKYNIGLYADFLKAEENKPMPVRVLDLIRPSQQAAEKMTSSSRVNRAILMMREQFAQPLSTVDVARTVGLSERHFRRQFHDTLGITPYEFLLQTRLQHACRQLLQTNKTITDIAHESGFSDHSAFTKMFHERMDITPSAYRQRRVEEGKDHMRAAVKYCAVAPAE